MPHPDSHFTLTAAQKIRLALPCARQRLLPRRHLIAGPYTGEFGYELMQWQGYIRARRAAYESVHILTYPGRDSLYEGCTVHHHDVELRTAGYGYGHMPRTEKLAMAHQLAAKIGLENYDIFETSLLCTRYHKMLFWGQEFRLLQEPAHPGGIRDVAFHFRAVKKEGSDHMKNYQPERCEELVSRCRDAGLTVISIGHPDYSICPAGAEDFRSVDLRASIAAICSARVVAGENSGPMHLANLCGQPTVLWAQDQWRIDYSLRWNPFRVPIYTAANDTCQPLPALVCAALQDALQDLRQHTQDFRIPSYTLPARPISRV